MELLLENCEDDYVDKICNLLRCKSVCFSFWMVLDFIYFHPSFIHPNVVLGFIKTIITYGSIPALVACLIGEVLYRKIKRCREFQFGILYL